MNRHNLEYFMEVYRQRNIQAAADDLFISHQGLSRVLRSLEEELGHPLFKRTNRGVVPTDFAIQMVPHVEAILDSYERIGGMQLRADMSTSNVVLYCMDHVPRYFGTDFFLDFRKKHPGLTVTLVETTDEGAVKALRNKKADLAISNDSGYDSRITREFLFRPRACARMSKDNPLAAKKLITPEDLQGCRVAGKGREYRCFRKHLEWILFTCGVHVDIVLEASDEHMLEELAERDEAIVLTYDFSALADRSPNTVIRYFEENRFNTELYLMKRSHNELTEPAQMLWDYFIEWRDVKDRFSFA